MNTVPSADMTSVWAYGIVEPGWYIAKLLWDQSYAEHLQSLGYRVVRSVKKPIDGQGESL